MKYILLFLSLFVAIDFQAQTGLVINEFMASNDTTMADQDGDFDDWIELYNNTSSNVSLDGFHLSDDIANPIKWTFPVGTSIAPNDYLIVWADEDENQAGLHAAFKLSAAGETVLLYNAAGDVVDSLTYPNQNTDISHGRFPNGTGEFRDMTPTFDAQNLEGITESGDTTLAISPLAGDLTINEFMASNEGSRADQDGEFDDWIELYNNTASNVTLDGFFLSDDLGNLSKWAFPAGTSISGNDYLTLWADEDEDQTGLHAGFKLSAEGEMIILADANGALIDTITFFQQDTDLSYGRFPNGTGAFRSMNPTFGEENIGDGTATRSSPLDIELTLSPNPTADILWVSLENAHSADLQLDLLSAAGRLLRQTTLKRGATVVEMDAGDLSSGTYLLSITDGAATETRKVVVRH